jgi:cobyrinic acid a,c-diamide synthase
MQTMTLIFALSLLAMAQNVTPNRAIVGYVAVSKNAAQFSFHYTDFLASIPAAGCDLVVYSDGEVAGPDTAHSFGAVADQINQARSFARKVLDNPELLEHTVKANRKKVLSGAGAEVVAHDVHFSNFLAEQFYQLQETSGLDAAMAAIKRLATLPTLWKGKG